MPMPTDLVPGKAKLIKDQESFTNHTKYLKVNAVCRVINVGLHGMSLVKFTDSHFLVPGTKILPTFRILTEDLKNI